MWIDVQALRKKLPYDARRTMSGLPKFVNMNVNDVYRSYPYAHAQELYCMRYDFKFAPAAGTLTGSGRL